MAYGKILLGERCRISRMLHAKMLSPPPIKYFASRGLSSVIERKEHAEETIYIRSQEAARQAKIREDVERILALEDDHEHKQDLQELLGIDYFKIFSAFPNSMSFFPCSFSNDLLKYRLLTHFRLNLLRCDLQKNQRRPRDESFISRWGLNDWKFALPIGMFVAIPALYNEVL